MIGQLINLEKQGANNALYLSSLMNIASLLADCVEFIEK